MSWTDIFPVLDDEMLGHFRQEANEAERREFEGLLGTASVHRAGTDGIGGEAAGRRDGVAPQAGRKEGGGRRHIVSAALFWKHVNGKNPELPRPTREMLVDARRMAKDTG
jgi:hypothetical protein